MVKMPFEKKKKPDMLDVEELIDKGAPDKESLLKEKPEEWIMINLRLPKKMLKEIDNEVKKNIGLTRTGWILQTIQKQLKRLLSEDS